MIDRPSTSLLTIYTGRVTNWPALTAAAAGSVGTLGLGHAVWGSWQVAAVLFGAGVITLLLYVSTGSSVRATTGSHGVTVRLGLFGWPRATYAAADLIGADVVDLPWWSVAYGLWWTPRRTCWTVRGGPTLRLRLYTGRSVTISVPDPMTALNALAIAR